MYFSLGYRQIKCYCFLHETSMKHDERVLYQLVEIRREAPDKVLNILIL